MTGKMKKNQAHPCDPASVKEILAIIGDALRAKAHFGDTSFLHDTENRAALNAILADISSVKTPVQSLKVGGPAQEHSGSGRADPSPADISGGKKETKNTLRRNEELYRGIFENAAEGIYLLEVTKDGRFKNLAVNKALAESSGVRSEDLIGRYVDETISPEVGELVVAKYQEVIDSGHVVRKDIDLPFPSGTRTFHSSLVPIRNAEGRIDRILGITYDITEHRKTELALRQSEERFRTLTETSLVGLYISVDGIIRYVNPVMSEIVGYPPESRIGVGKSPLDFVHPDDRAMVQTIMQDRIAGKPVPDVYETRLVTRDNRTITVSVRAVIIPYEGRRGIYGQILDITEQKQVEVSLKRSEERYRDMFELNNAVMLIIDPKTGKIEDANAAAALYYGYSKEELQELRITDINTLDPARIKEEMHRAQGSDGAIFQFRHKKKSGEIRDVEAFSGPITLGNRKYLYSIIHDVTDRKRAEDAVQAANRLNEKIDTLSIGDCMVSAVDEAERLTASSIGFFHFINEKEHTIGLLGWSTETKKRCSLKSEGQSRYSFEKSGLWADCLRERRPVFHNDYPAMTRKNGLPAGHVPLIRELCVPVFDENEIVAVIGVGNKESAYDDQDVAILTLLAKNAWTLIRRKRVEEALREGEQQYRTLFEESPVALVKADFSAFRQWLDTERGKGNRNIRTYFEMHPEEIVSCWKRFTITRINGAAKTLFGINSLNDISDNPPASFSRESLDAFREALIAISSGNSEFGYEFPTTTRQGEKKTLLTKISIIHGSEETLGKVLVSFLDITERKKMEDALRQANIKISMLSSITRHDIRNQLTALQLFIHMSDEAKNNPDRLAEYFKKELKIADTIATQIEFTRNYEAIGVNAPEWQDPLLLAHAAQKQLQIPKEIRVEIDIPPVRIYADRLIEKVVYNLFENTLRHGGTITRIRISFEVLPGGGAVLVYEDDGVGITSEDKIRLFQKGFGKNTGLGLFLSREILAITGLTIRETGEPGKGVRFEIALPPGEYRLGGDR